MFVQESFELEVEGFHRMQAIASLLKTSSSLTNSDVSKEAFLRYAKTIM